MLSRDGTICYARCAEFPAYRFPNSDERNFAKRIAAKRGSMSSVSLKDPARVDESNHVPNRGIRKSGHRTRQFRRPLLTPP